MLIQVFRLSRCVLLWACAAGWWLSPAARAQELAEDMVGQNAAAWEAWQEMTQAIGRDEGKKVPALAEKIAGFNLSELRLALMAERTGSLRLEQMAEKEDAAASVKALVERITAGRRQKALAEDGWHFAAIGRFNYADANFKALAESNPDPVALLELARANPNRHTILIKLISNAEVGEAAKQFLQLLDRGEEMLRTDPYEIVSNIRKLAGPPRMAHNAAQRLKASGEFAVSHLLQFLQQPDKSSAHVQILQLLPQLGRDALNPLCIALGMKDNVVRQAVVSSLVQIGYRQALPYLAKLADDSGASAELRAAARQAVTTIGRGTVGSKADLFFEVAEGYYNEVESYRPDPRRDAANVWYLRENELRVVEVPTRIFCDVMAMRCCEEALLADPDKAEATALWLAANIRREARLGMDVESEAADPLAVKDATRPENFPRSIYFSRAAGARYSHMVLARAVKDRDAGVALGAIAALSETAGEPGLVGAEDIKQPLVQCLEFPNRQVRIKASLALGRALPKTAFSGHHNVVDVLAEALAASERQGALVVDPAQASANRVQAVLRAAGYDCATGPDVYQARDSAQKSNLTSFDLIVLASDIHEPELASAIVELRREFRTASTPVLVLTKPGEGQLRRASEVSRGAAGVEVLLADVLDLGDPEKIREQVTSRIGRAAQALGMSRLAAEQSLDLALQSAEVLRMIAETRSKVFDHMRAVPALLHALGSKSETLRTRCAHVLALAASADAQAAILRIALGGDYGPAERIAAFGALAESARRNGNLLGTSDLVDKLVDFAMREQDLTLRTAASKALGALNLAGNKASEIIRAQHKG